MTSLKLIITMTFILLLASVNCAYKPIIKKPDITWQNGPVDGAIMWLDAQEFMELQAYIQSTQTRQYECRPLE